CVSCALANPLCLRHASTTSSGFQQHVKATQVTLSLKHFNVWKVELAKILRKTNPFLSLVGTAPRSFEIMASCEEKSDSSTKRGQEPETTKPEPVFKDISAHDPSQETTEVESMCVNCHENGITRLLLAKIPHYREVILMSFHCEACGFQNNEIQSGGRIQEQGVQLKVKIQSVQDLSRQVVKSDSATLTIPEIGLEIPPDSQKGAITTVEGILQRTVAGLKQDQPVRRVLDEDGANQIDEYCLKVEALGELKEPFTLILRDPSGNSFIENLHAPHTDPAREVVYFTRTPEEDHALAIYSQEELHGAPEESKEQQPTGENTEDDPGALTEERLENEVLTFATNCPDCNAPAATNMKMTKIPHFKEVVIMATVCDFCGHKTNEVKSGGGIEPQGTKITLKVTDPTDLSRDVLKAETCNVALPDLDFEIGGFALGGRFTTLEGLLQNILEKVEDNPFLGTASSTGDSTTKETQNRLQDFNTKLQEFIGGSKTFTVVLDDPTGNSYLQVCVS
ncbi:hypothetical protein TCAL_05293, partial [Tigriopus californicus]